MSDREGKRLWLFLCAIPVIWLAVLAAPFMRDGIISLLENFEQIIGEPFAIKWCEDSVKTVLIFLGAYVFGIGIYYSMRRNYRRGEEYGSARWGRVKEVNKKYSEALPEANLILTQNVRMGLDGRKHRRNLNVLVCGGSGAGKTRFYCKPNLMQANTSFVVLDPKGQLKCERALNLPSKFTYFRERRWQKWLNLRLYGILPSTSDSLKMMNLKVNLTVFPIRKST